MQGWARLWCVGIVCALGCSDARELMPIREVVHDVLAEDDFEVTRARTDAAPRIGVITPSINALDDAGDRTALILPPPAEARFVVPSGASRLTLRASAGVDLSVARALVGSGAALQFGFAVLVNGEQVFSHVQQVEPQRAQETNTTADQRNRWTTVGTGRGLELRPGDEVTLRTTLPQENAAGLAPEQLVAGFGDLVFERTQEIARERASVKAPNVVLVVMDTLRADRTSTFGYERRTTPQLTQLAARGIAFDAAYATSSWTWPSTASLLTGLSPEEHGVEDYRSCTLASELETLAEALQREGVTTAAFSGNPLIAPARNFDQGFETFDAAEELRMSDAVVPDALRWLEDNHERRFFLYLHLVDPHSPHTPRAADLMQFTGSSSSLFPIDLLDQLGFKLLAEPSRSREIASERQRTWLSDVYDASVATGDHWLGEVLATLERLGHGADTLIAFTSDHGEELFDRERLGHSHSLHGELVHVPLVLAGPGVPAGVRVDHAVSNRHLGPTLARLAGTALPNARDALQLDQHGSLTEGEVYTSTHKGIWNGRQRQHLLGLRADNWCLIAPIEEGRPGQLFDLSSDARERRNVASANRERAAALTSRLRRRSAELAQHKPQLRRPAGERTLKVLEGMGYAGADEDDE